MPSFWPQCTLKWVLTCMYVSECGDSDNKKHWIKVNFLHYFYIVLYSASVCSYSSFHARKAHFQWCSGGVEIMRSSDGNQWATLSLKFQLYLWFGPEHIVSYDQSYKQVRPAHGSIQVSSSLWKHVASFSPQGPVQTVWPGSNTHSVSSLINSSHSKLSVIIILRWRMI